MFDKVSQAAEKLATNVSRRAFLGGLGEGALTVAGVVGGMLAFGSVAWADPPYNPCPDPYHFCDLCNACILGGANGALCNHAGCAKIPKSGRNVWGWRLQ